MEPTASVQALRASTADLLLGLADEPWRDADIAAPSLCAGWSRGHVLTHLARNADGVVSTLSGALRGEVVARYPNGPAGRDADIAAGSGRPLVELIADVRDSADRLDRMFAAVTEAGGWELPTEDQLPASHWPAARWREVEIHRIDLAGSYLPDRWPPPFVAWLLPDALETLAGRAQQPLSVTVIGAGSLGGDSAAVSRSADGLADVPADGSADGSAAGEVIDVSGPDWAVLAWLLGRVMPEVRAALTAAPDVEPWR